MPFRTIVLLKKKAWQVYFVREYMRIEPFIQLVHTFHRHELTLIFACGILSKLA